MAFHYRLEHQDGAPADPPTFHTAIRLAAGRHDPLRQRTLRVVEVRPARDPDENGVLVVERE